MTPAVISLGPGRATARRMASLAAAGRLLRLELKRNVVPYVLPLLAAVFYFDTFRTADGYPPVWTVRASVIGDHMLFEFSAFAGGMAAWAGSRERRRKALNLVASTPRAVWARLSVTLAGTLGWLLLAFLAGVAAIYIPTALQATWGGPPLWPVLAGAAGVIVVTIIGFACGVFFPGRFTAPLVAIGLLVLYQAGFREALGVTASPGTDALLSPASAVPAVDAGVYQHVAPDVPITQVMFMGGIAVALLGVLALAAALRQRASARGRMSLRAWPARGDNWLLRTVAVVLVAAGVAASWTAYSLAGTAKLTATGWQIPALHDAARDRPVPFVPDCRSAPGGFQVCVHPAFSGYLGDVAAALDPVAAEIAGLPGAPVRAEQVASAGTWPQRLRAEPHRRQPAGARVQRGRGRRLVRGVLGNPGRRLAGLARRIPAGSPRPVPHRTAAFGGRGANRAHAARRGAAGGGGRADDRGRLAAPAAHRSARSFRRSVTSADHRRRLAVRVAARQCAARLAGGPPGRLAGRHDHSGPDPVIAAAAALRPAPARTAGAGRAGVRLAWLHVRSRRVPAGILALALCGGVLRAALHWHWAFSSGPYAQQIPMIIEAGAAAVIAVTSHSPFGETERATGRWLPYLRLFAAAGMCGLAIALLQLGAAGESLNEGILVLARNVTGITGIGLLCSLVTGGLLAWTLPMGYLAFCQYALLQGWTAPWTWPVRPPADRGAWICACAVFTVGLLLFTIRGPRTRLSDEE